MDFEMPSFIDGEVVGSIPYWILTAGAMLALAIGFVLTKQWGNGTIPWWNQILILSCIPVVAYFIVLYNQRR